jgi:hypothetical protein
MTDMTCNDCRNKASCHYLYKVFDSIFNSGLFSLQSRTVVANEILKLFSTHCSNYEPKVMK